MDITYEVFDKNIHNRDNFDCGENSLNNFIKSQANQRQKRHDAVTHVAVSRDSEIPKIILGFYTLSNNALLYQSLPKKQVKVLPEMQAIPSVKIARLARNSLYTNSGFGEYILMDALRYIYKMATTQIGIYAIDVDVVNEHVKKFYKKFGFTELQDSEASMFITIETVEGIIH